MTADLIIFDCDGVLVDSETIANQCLAQAVSALGLPLDEAGSRQRFVGLSMTSICAMIEAELGKPLPSGWLDQVHADTYAGFHGALQPVPGAAEAVDAVLAAGLAVCVASSGGHDKLALTLGLTGLAPRFQGRIFSASEVARGKPAPDLFLHAAARMGVAPARAIVIEDSIPGTYGAVAAGMRVFGLARETPAAALAAAGATVFTAMSELPALLGLDGTYNDAIAV